MELRKRANDGMADDNKNRRKRRKKREGKAKSLNVMSRSDIIALSYMMFLEFY